MKVTFPVGQSSTRAMQRGGGRSLATNESLSQSPGEQWLPAQGRQQLGQGEGSSQSLGKGVGLCLQNGAMFRRDFIARHRAVDRRPTDLWEEGEILCQLSQDNGILFPLQ